jgi:hypothetical protein
MDVQSIPSLSEANSLVMQKSNCSCDKFYELPTTKAKRHTSTVISQPQASDMAKKQTWNSVNTHIKLHHPLTNIR